MGAMGYAPSLYINHDLKRAWFSNVELIVTKWDEKDNRYEGFSMEDADNYGNEIEYEHAKQIFVLAENGFNAINDDK